MKTTPGTELGPVSVGSGGAWRVEGNGVADKHAYLFYDGEQLFVQSCGVDAPVLVDGQPVPLDWTPLTAPCIIGMGDVKLRYMEQDSSIDDDDPDDIATRVGGAEMLVMAEISTASGQIPSSHAPSGLVPPSADFSAFAGSAAPPGGQGAFSDRDDDSGVTRVGEIEVRHNAQIAAAAMSMTEMLADDEGPTKLQNPIHPTASSSNLPRAPGIGPPSGVILSGPAAGAPPPAPAAPSFGAPPAAPAFGAPPPSPSQPGMQPPAPSFGSFGGGAGTGPQGAALSSLGGVASPADVMGQAPPAGAAPLHAQPMPGEYAPPAPGTFGPVAAKTGFWAEASAPKKVTLLLLPILVLAVMVIFSEDPRGLVGLSPPPAKGQTGAPAASASAQASASAKVDDPAPDGDDGNPVVASSPRPKPSEEDEEAKKKPPTRPGKPEKKERTLERKAADLVAGGNYAEAAAIYEELAKKYPDNAVFPEAAKIMAAKAGSQ